MPGVPHRFPRRLRPPKMAREAPEPSRPQARELPKGTKVSGTAGSRLPCDLGQPQLLTAAAAAWAQVPLERATPLLACAVTKWLRAHGKVRMLAGCKVGPVPNRGSALRPWPLLLPHVVGGQPAASALARPAACSGHWYDYDLPNTMQTVRPKLTDDQKANLKTCFKYMDAGG